MKGYWLHPRTIFRIILALVLIALMYVAFTAGKPGTAYLCMFALAIVSANLTIQYNGYRRDLEETLETSLDEADRIDSTEVARAKGWVFDTGEQGWGPPEPTHRHTFSHKDPSRTCRECTLTIHELYGPFGSTEERTEHDRSFARGWDERVRKAQARDNLKAMKAMGAEVTRTEQEVVATLRKGKTDGNNP